MRHDILRSRRLLFSFSAAFALTVASIVTAMAHATLEKAEASAGSYKAVMRIPHGCGDKPTDTVRIELPEGFIAAKPMPKAGWEVVVEKGDYAKTYDYFGSELKAGPKAVVWKGGSLPSDFYDEFVISGQLAEVEDGQVLSFITTQSCDVDQVSWNEIPAAGQDPHSLKHPAPGLVIKASETGGHAAHDHGAMAAAPETAPVKAGDLEITGYWTRAMLNGQPAGGGFMKISNTGKDADKLIAGSSPSAPRVEIHMMEVVDGVMNMRPVEGGLEIPAGGSVELKPGSFHVMFMGVPAPFQEGAVVNLTLEFEKAGKVDLVLPVMPANAKQMQHGEMKHGEMDHAAMHGQMDDAGQIEHLLKAQFDSPEAPLTVAPVAVQNGFAVAGWSQTGKGGRALLRKKDDQWVIHLCTGADAKQAAKLTQMGVPEADAQAIAATLAAEEAKLGDELTARLDSFEGTLMIEGGDPHAKHKHGG